MSNRIITKGKYSSLEPTTGWEIEDDGYGMLSSMVLFKGDIGAENPAKMSAHPGDQRLQLHKLKYKLVGGKTKEVTAFYVGLAAGSKSTIQWFPDVSSTTSKIQAHPNFLKATFGTDKPLVDLGWDLNTKTFPDKGQAAEKGLAAVENFLSSEVSVSGIFYTSDKSYVQKWMDGNNKTFQALPDTETLVLPSKYQPISSFHDRFALLTGVNYEMFAHLYKVSFQVRTASGGWHKYLYDRAPTQ